MHIEANGVRLEYEVYGPDNDPALVLIRGLGSQMVQWPSELIQGFIGCGFRVVTFDNRDAGLSARCPMDGVSGDADDIVARLRAGQMPAHAYSLHDMARDVVGLLDGLEIARAHILGISMGGAITQILAANHTDRLITATIVMSAARFAPDRIEAILVRPLDRDAFIEAALEADRVWGSPGYPLDQTYLRKQAALVFDRGADAHAINRQALAIIASGDRADDLRAIDLPCLVIHGAEDALIPPDAGREIASLIPGAELAVVPGMGHTITPSLAPLIVQRVTTFLQGTA